MIIRSAYLIFLVLVLISCSADKGECPFCNVRMPHDARVMVLVEGESKPKMACSITCVLHYERATGKKIKFLRVSDFYSGNFLNPGEAFYVIGSDVNPFDKYLHSNLLSQSRTPIYMDWNRYTPTVLAFASREDAEKFQRDHGGRVATSSILKLDN
jgi:nitrous oxide reductase accessory protein NosL